MVLGRPTPNPGLGAPVELRGGDVRGLFDLLGVGEALPGERIAAEEAPPTLLQIEPARPSRNKDVMDAWMFFQPGAGLQARVTAEIVADDEDVSFGIVGFNIGQKRDVAFGIARGGASGEFLAIAHSEGSVDPSLLEPAPVFQRCLDAVTLGRPAWGRIEGTGDYRSEFVGADGRRAFCWLSVVADDRRSFETKSLS